MSTEIFVNSCTSCGITAMLIAKVKRHHPDAKVIDTRKGELERHVQYLKSSGIEVSEYVPIVVENNGEVITRLKDWRG